MKRSKTTFGKLILAITALLLLQNHAAFSQSAIQVALHRPGTEITKLKIVTQELAEPATVTVRNVEGIVLFSDKCKADEYSKLLSFAKLNNGTYFIDLNQSKGITRKVIVKDETGIAIKAEDFYFSNFISFKGEDKKLVVRFNSNIEQPVTIRIADHTGKIIHEEKGITSVNYVNRFNLSSLTHGNYKVSLISGAYSSTKHIRI